MPGRARWAGVLEEARSELRRGEALQAVFPGLCQPALSSGRAGSRPWLRLARRPLATAASRLSRRRRLREQTRRSLFPLAPRMIIGLSNRRLLIWIARPGWRLGRFIGYVSRDRVLQAASPAGDTPWRTVCFYLATEPSVAIRVPARAAEDLARELSGRPELTGR